MKLVFALAATGLVVVAGAAALFSESSRSDFGGGFGSVFASGDGPGGVTEYHGCTKAVPPDYQQQAEDARWAFRDDEAGLPFCLGKSQPRYTVAATAPVFTGGGLRVHVSLLGTDVYTFPAHEHTVFDIVGHRLYYAEFDPAAGRAAVVSVDLTTGTELWRTKLRGTGQTAGETAPTRLNLRAGEDGVTVLGREAGGRYIEVLDPETGETAGHKSLD